MAGIRKGTGDRATDTALADVWRRLDALERRTSPQGIADIVVNNLTIEQFVTEVAGSGSSLLFAANGFATGNANPNWLNIGFIPSGGTTTLAAATYASVPAGVTRLVGLAFSTRTAGVSAINLTYRVTVGTSSTESDTALEVVVPATFAGTSNVTLSTSVAVTPGQAVRVKQYRSGILGAPGPTGVVCLVQTA